MAAEREPTPDQLPGIWRERAEELLRQDQHSESFAVAGALQLCAEELEKRLGQVSSLHLVTDADLRVLEGCSKLDLGEVRYLAKHHEHDWAHAELARRGEKP